MSILVEPRLLQAEGDVSSDEIAAIQSYILEGEYEPAIIVEDGDEALAAVACAKADAIIHVRFSPEMTKFLKDNYQIAVGSRLVSINAYSEAAPAHPDLVMYGREAGRYKQVHPIIAETVAASPEELHEIRESLATDYDVLQERYRDDETRYIRRSQAMQSHKVVDLWDRAQELTLDEAQAEEPVDDSIPQWQTQRATAAAQTSVRLLDPWAAYPLAALLYFIGGILGVMLFYYVATHGIWHYSVKEIDVVLMYIGIGLIVFPAALLPMLFCGRGRRLLMAGLILALSYVILITIYVFLHDLLMEYKGMPGSNEQAAKDIGEILPYLFLVYAAQVFGGWLAACALIGFARLFNRPVS